MNPATTVKPIVIVASKVTEEPIKPNKSMFHHVKLHKTFTSRSIRNMRDFND